MPSVQTLYSASEVAEEAGCDEGRVHWLEQIGLLRPDERGRFTYGSVLAVKMVIALMEGGIAIETIEHAVAGGMLAFQRLDEYLPYEPGRRSDRTFADFQADAGRRAGVGLSRPLRSVSIGDHDKGSKSFELRAGHDPSASWSARSRMTLTHVSLSTPQSRPFRTITAPASGAT
jgi:hypothetical protein